MVVNTSVLTSRNRLEQHESAQTPTRKIIYKICKIVKILRSGTQRPVSANSADPDLIAPTQSGLVRVYTQGQGLHSGQGPAQLLAPSLHGTRVTKLFFFFFLFFSEQLRSLFNVYKLKKKF